jgi:hypothetical protein
MSYVALTGWPAIPDSERAKGPKALYISEHINDALRAKLTEAGWHVVDVRVLSGAESVRATLEGVRVGSIDTPTKNPTWLKALELEARTYKLLSDKTQAPKAAKSILETEEDIDSVLSFSAGAKAPSFQPPAAQTAPAEPKAKSKGGRPKGAKDSKPRNPGPVRGVVLQNRLKKLNADRDLQSLPPLEKLPEDEVIEDVRLR